MAPKSAWEPNGYAWQYFLFITHRKRLVLFFCELRQRRAQTLEQLKSYIGQESGKHSTSKMTAVGIVSSQAHAVLLKCEAVNMTLSQYF